MDRQILTGFVHIRTVTRRPTLRPTNFEVDPYLAAPTGVKATVNKADGSITVKWNPVAGADYYEVYRTTRAAYAYNKDTKTYSYAYGYANPLDNWVVDANSKYGYKISDEDLTATTTTDRKVSYVKWQWH